MAVRDTNTQSASKEATAPEAVIASGGRPSSRRWLFIAAVVVVLLAIGVGAYAYARHRQVVQKEAVSIPSSDEAYTRQLNSLNSNAPTASSSSTEKLAYYDKLFQTQEGLGNYKAAADAFTKREAVSTSGLTYGDYWQLATCYKNLGNKTAALQALNKAESVLPPGTNDTTGYSHDDVLSNINAFRQELQK